MVRSGQGTKVMTPRNLTLLPHFQGFLHINPPCFVKYVQYIDLDVKKCHNLPQTIISS